MLERLSNRRIFVDFLALMFGLGAWIGVNGIWVQLPLLVNSAPEKWLLAMKLVVVVQLANLGPLIYTLYTKYSRYRVRDGTIIYFLLGSATVSTYLMAFYYDTQHEIFGDNHSTALLGLMFIISIVGCTSSVLFTPYMRNYREIYLVSFLVGEALSGFIPSMIALGQGVGGNAYCKNLTQPGDDKITLSKVFPDPRFSTRTFYLIMGSILLTTFLSFIALNKCRVAKDERVKPTECDETLPTDTNAPPSYKTQVAWKMSKQTYVLLLSMMVLLCFLSNGMLNGIQPFSSMPYGNVAYHLIVTLASIASPLASSMNFFFKKPKVKTLFVLSVMAVSFSAFVFFLAVKSPKPPMKDSPWGVLMIVITWITLNSLMSYVKTSIITLFRPDPGRGLYYTGVATQIGSMLGALTTYIISLIIKFKEYSPCDDF